MAKRMRKTRRKVSIRNKIGATVRGRIMAAKLGPTAGYEGYETVNEMVDVADKPEPKGRARKTAKVTASKAEKLTPTQFAKTWKAERTKAVAGDKQAAENLAQLRKTGIEQGILSPDGKRLNSHSDKKKAARAAKTDAKTRRAHNRATASIDDIHAARADQRPRDYWESVDAETMRKEQHAKEEIDSLRDLDEKGIADLRETTATQMQAIADKLNNGTATAADENELDELTHFAYALDAATLRESGFDPFDPDNTPEWTLTENFSALNDQDLQRIENNPFIPGWQRDLASEELEHRQPWRDGGILQSMLKDASITELRATQAMFMGDDAQYTNAELRQLAAKTGNARYAYDSDTFDADYAAWLENVTGEKLDPETFKKLNPIGGKPTPEQQAIIDKLGYIPNRANYARTLRNEPVNTTTGKPRTHRNGQPEPDGYDNNLEALYGKDTINATADEINNIQAMDTDQVETELTAAINNLKQWGHPPQFADVHDEYQFDRALHHAFMLDAEAHARRNQNTDTGEPNPFHDEPPAFGDATADNFDPFDDALLAEKERARLAEIDSDELETLAADASATGNTQYSDFIWDELQHRNPEIEGGEIDQALPYAGIRELTALYKKWAPDTPIDNAFKERIKEQAARRGNERYRNHPAAQEEYDNWLDTVLNVDDGKGGKINIRDGLYMGDKTDPNGGGLYKDANGNFKPVTLSFEEAITNDMMAVQLGEEISRAIEENIGFLPNQTNFMKMVRGERPKQFHYSPDERRDMATMGGRKSRPKTVKEKLEKEKAEAKNTGATNTPDATDKPRKATPDAPETPEATNLKKRLEEATRAENQRHKDNAEARKQQGTAEVQQGEQLKENGEIVRDAAIIYPRDNGGYSVKPYTPTGQGDKRAPNGKGHPAKDIEEARELADTITAMVGMSDADIRAAIDGDDKRRAEMAIAERDRRAALNKADAKPADGKATDAKARADKPATPNKDTEKARTAAAKRTTAKPATAKRAAKPQAKKEDTGNKETKRTTTTSAKTGTEKTPAKNKPGNTETTKKPEQAKPKQDTKPAAHKRGEPFTEQHLQDGETITDTGSIQRGDFTIISSADGYRIMEQFDSHRMTKPMKKTLAKVRADVDRKQAERTQSEANKKAKAQPVTYNKTDGKEPATPAKPAVKPVSQAERNKTAKLDAALKAAIRQDTTGNTKKQAHKLVADRLGISGATTQEDFTKRVNEYVDANGELTTLEENALIDYAVKNKLSTRDNNGMPIYLRDNAQRTAEEERRLTRAELGMNAQASKLPTGTRELSVNHRPTKTEIAEAIRTLNAKPETKEVKKPTPTPATPTGSAKPVVNEFTPAKGRDKGKKRLYINNIDEIIRDDSTKRTAPYLQDSNLKAWVDEDGIVHIDDRRTYVADIGGYTHKDLKEHLQALLSDAVGRGLVDRHGNEVTPGKPAVRKVSEGTPLPEGDKSLPATPAPESAPKEQPEAPVTVSPVTPPSNTEDAKKLQSIAVKDGDTARIVRAQTNYKKTQDNPEELKRLLKITHETETKSLENLIALSEYLKTHPEERKTYPFNGMQLVNNAQAAREQLANRQRMEWAAKVDGENIISRPDKPRALKHWPGVNTTSPHDEDLVITHEPGEGTMIHGTSRGDGTAAILKKNGWKWSRNLRAWYIPNSRDNRPNMRKINTTSRDLMAEGHNSIGHDITNELEDALTRRAGKAQRLSDRADALEAKAERMDAKAEQAWQRHEELSRQLPPDGEPIKVGHHSESRHRRAIEKAWDSLGRSVQANKEAQEVHRRAGIARANALNRDKSPEYLRNRIEERKAAMRAAERDLMGTHTNGRPPVTGEAREIALENYFDAIDEMDALRALLQEVDPNALTETLENTDGIEVGDTVKIGKERGTVLKVTPKTVTIRYRDKWSNTEMERRVNIDTITAHIPADEETRKAIKKESTAKAAKTEGTSPSVTQRILKRHAIEGEKFDRNGIVRNGIKIKSSTRGLGTYMFEGLDGTKIKLVSASALIAGGPRNLDDARVIADRIAEDLKLDPKFSRNQFVGESDERLEEAYKFGTWGASELYKARREARENNPAKEGDTPKGKAGKQPAKNIIDTGERGAWSRRTGKEQTKQDKEALEYQPTPQQLDPNNPGIYVNKAGYWGTPETISPGTEEPWADEPGGWRPGMVPAAILVQKDGKNYSIDLVKNQGNKFIVTGTEVDTGEKLTMTADLFGNTGETYTLRFDPEYEGIYSTADFPAP